MSRHFFRAMRDFAFVHLPRYLRVFAIFLIFASPVLVSLYFNPTLVHFNKVTYCVPSFALFALSAIIFYGLRYYLDYDLRYYLDYDRFSREPWGEISFQENLPRHVSILLGIAIELFVIGGIIFPTPL
jgi:hypothetical protein